MELSGNFFDYFVVFFSGVLVSFTPCVYPLIPITASLVAGADTFGTRFSGLIFSLVYVLGIAITYSALAVFSSLTGRIFGVLQHEPLMYLFISIVLVVFSLIMFDVIKLNTIVLTKQHHKKPKNLWAILLFGMTSGLIIGPCTAPILGTLLLYTASKKNLLHGISLVFAFSYGVGFSLILVGTFSGMLSLMPKTNIWHIRIKKFCGVIILLAGLYFLYKGVLGVYS